MTAESAGTADADPGDGRHESPNERLDRNWGEILQELRVTQTGTQILTGFLLTISFQQKFDTLSAGQQREAVLCRGAHASVRTRGYDWVDATSDGLVTVAYVCHCDRGTCGTRGTTRGPSCPSNWLEESSGARLLTTNA